MNAKAGFNNYIDTGLRLQIVHKKRPTEETESCGIKEFVYDLTSLYVVVRQDKKMKTEVKSKGATALPGAPKPRSVFDINISQIFRNVNSL